jgi:hypothetical protein
VHPGDYPNAVDGDEFASIQKRVMASADVKTGLKTTFTGIFVTVVKPLDNLHGIPVDLLKGVFSIKMLATCGKPYFKIWIFFHNLILFYWLNIQNYS